MGRTEAATTSRLLQQPSWQPQSSHSQQRFVSKNKLEEPSINFFFFSVAEAAALQQAQARGVLLAANPSLARSPTMAVAGAPIVMSPGRGATSTASATSAASQLTAAHQMLTLQSQLQSQNNVAAAQVCIITIVIIIIIIILKSKIEFGIFRPSQLNRLSSNSNSSRQPPQPRCKTPNTSSCS